ncbi:MAG: hypothetical protein M3O70_24015 [Actinomycetota bacterium]|nr:hypothetical protein [Actinomycetota bacterium]
MSNTTTKSTGTSATAAATTAGSSRRLRTGAGLMAIAGLAFVGYGIVFFSRNYTDQFLELGIGANEVSVGRTEIFEFSPSLFHYLSHLHIAVSGFIAAAGVAVAALAWYGVRRGQLWAWVTAVAVPVLGLGVALPAHYPNDFDTLPHLGPIYLATVIFVAGALYALPGVVRGRDTSTTSMGG